MNNKALIQVMYRDFDKGIFLKNYADTIVYDPSNGRNLLITLRFGGYPEQVRAMSDAIYGGGTVCASIDGKETVLTACVKQYRRELSSDGNYAEATIMIEDDRIVTNLDIGNDSPNQAQNKFFVCERENLNQVFGEIDKKVSVPLIPQFQDFFLKELQEKKILQRMCVISNYAKIDVWKLSLSKDEKNIIDIVNTGLTTGQIKIPDPMTTGNSFPAIDTVTQYLNTFGVVIADRIQKQFNPLFNPKQESISKNVLSVNKHIFNHAGYNLYDAQLCVIEALKRSLDRKKIGVCIAECGSGKTKIGSAVLCAYQMGKQRTKFFNVVLCPSHMTRKWIREIEETLPNSYAMQVQSVAELEKVYTAYQKGTQSCYVVISKEKARDGYMKRPSVTWNKRKQAFLCPSCKSPIMMEVLDCGSKYRVEADSFFFLKENAKNHKCDHCDAMLWTMLVPSQQSEWVKITDYGFVNRHTIAQHIPCKSKNAKVIAKIEAIANNPNGVFSASGAYARYPLSSYIKNKMRGRIDGLIVDELHQYNNASGQGDAMAELAGAAKKVIGLTATLINGYSSGIFYLLYRICPNLMLMDGKTYENIQSFNDEYGVTERVFRTSDGGYNKNRRTVKKNVRTKQLPGVSPLIYSRFLMDSTVFLSLHDMGKQLPDYEEIPIELTMTPEVTNEYKRLENEFIHVLKHEKDIASKVMSAFVSLLTVYPDQAYDQPPIYHPLSKLPIVEPMDCASIDELSEKDIRILALVKEKIENNERVIIYTSWIRIDTQKKLKALLDEHGIHSAILNATTSPQKREDWVENRINSGVQVLITNPSLVETGLDLNDFTTLIYYNIGYNLFTLRQSSRRSWRINQRAKRVEVYFFYYSNVMQHRAIRLMASKLAVAGIIEGNLSDEGLAAMSECQDLTALMVQELTTGIKDDVENLSDMFKQMAVLKANSSDREQSLYRLDPGDIEETADTLPRNVGTLKDDNLSSYEVLTGNQDTQTPEEPLFSLPIQEVERKQQPTVNVFFHSSVSSGTKKTRRKSPAVDENQLTLFDVYGIAN